jgi:hypothetical protein
VRPLFIKNTHFVVLRALETAISFAANRSINMKKILSFPLLLLAFFGANAQQQQGDFTFGVGLNLGLPVGNFHLINSFGVGGHLQGEYNFTDNITGVLTTGYTSFFGKSISVDNGLGGTASFKQPAIGLIPVVVGPRFYPVDQFFVGVQAGIGFLTGGGSSTSGFDYYPQVGYNADNFQVILGYNGVSANGGTLGNLSLTGVFKFGGNK